MAIDIKVQSAVIAAARAARIEPAALLAVVEIESAGRLFEEDNRTPRLLFERHVFYRELKKRAPGKLQAAIDAGLAIPKWSRSTQYTDQGSSKARLRLMDRARAIDAECANRSASWGLGQTMGFNAEGLGFQDATGLVAYMITGGIPAHVDCMVREIKRNKLERFLPPRPANWAGFARGYNGPGFAQNQYDTKLAAAYRKWKAALDPANPETGSEPVEIPPSRVAEPAPMSQSTIGNGAIGGGAAATAGGGLMVLDKLSDVPESTWDRLIELAQKPTFAAGTILLVGAIGFFGYIWWKRRRLKQDAGV